MRKLLLGILLLTFFACVEDRDVFVQSNLGGPQQALKDLVQSPSFAKILEPNQAHTITTDYNAIISLPAEVLVGSESNEIQFIEMNSPLDNILNNVEHRTSEGILHSVYSFYIDINSLNDSSIDEFQKPVIVKIPSNKYNTQPILGIGSFESSRLNWDYNQFRFVNTINYGIWDAESEDGSLYQENGYILEINQSGWYNLAIKQIGEISYNNLCVEFSDSRFNSDNTISLATANDLNYNSFLYSNNAGDGTYCASALPFLLSQSYSLVAVAVIDDQKYFGKQTVYVTQNEAVLDMVPITDSDLLDELIQL